MNRRVVISVGLLVLLSILATGLAQAQGPGPQGSAAPQETWGISDSAVSGTADVSSGIQIGWLACSPMPVTVT
jgi:hypothetical protein